MKHSESGFEDELETIVAGGRQGRCPTELKAWIDGEVALSRSLWLRMHLWTCPACREEVKWLKRLGEDMRDLERAVPSPRLRDRILASLPDAPPGRPDFDRRPFGRFQRLSPVFAAAGVCAFAVVASAFYFHNTHTVATTVPPHSTMPTVAGTAPNTEPVVRPDSGHSGETTDASSKLADEMLKRWLDQKSRRGAEQLIANRASWKSLLAAVRARRQSPAAKEPVRFAVAVLDVDEAAQRIETWARSLGGSPGRVTGQSAFMVGPTVDPRESSGSATPAPDSSFSRLVVVSVPANRVASLEPILKSSGALRGAYADTTGGPKSVVHGPSTGAGSGPPSMAKTSSNPSASDRLAPTGISKLSATDQIVGRDSAPLQITLHIQLSNLEGQGR